MPLVNSFVVQLVFSLRYDFGAMCFINETEVLYANRTLTRF